jgi:hypothetical protein
MGMRFISYSSSFRYRVPNRSSSRQEKHDHNIFYITLLNSHITPNNNTSQINLTCSKKILFNHAKQQKQSDTWAGGTGWLAAICLGWVDGCLKGLGELGLVVRLIADWDAYLNHVWILLSHTYTHISNNPIKENFLLNLYPWGLKSAHTLTLIEKLPMS